MLKRTNKLTALLVAATSVAAIAPTGVMAADVQRIPSEDGTVYSAEAFKDGSYVIDADAVTEDDDAVYYVKDGKYTELEDVDSGSTLSLYGDHYVSVDDGEYFIDLNTGKVTDDDIADDNLDDVQTSLRKQFKKVDRYGSTNDPVTVTSISGPNYGEVWYKTTQNVYDNDNKNVKDTTIYSDVNGNYIDADYNLGSIKVVTSSSASNTAVCTINNSEDSENGVKVGTTTAQVTANIVSGSSYEIGQDDDNIYRLAQIDVRIKNAGDLNGAASIQRINNLTVDNANVFSPNKDNTGYIFNVVQKISKAQASNTIDDANYAKTVSSYMICDKDGNVPDKSKIAALSKAIGYTVNNGNATVDSSAKFTIAGGNLVVYNVDSNNLVVQSAELKTKGALSYLDAKSIDDDTFKAYTTDSEGNLYRIKDGYVSEFDNEGDWNKLYKVDGSMDKLSVYDSNNMIVWNQGNEVFSVISSNNNNNSDNNNSDNNNSNTVTAGWNQAANGTWTYVNADGTTVKGWFQSPYSQNWFFMDPTTGVMQTGWVQSPYSGKWFYMDPTNGNMLTGWVQSPASGKWYFMDLANGNMLTGWVQSPYSGKWY
ncbi:N-acetylmuramoyl-L-alanine amidase family protein, partial [Clostridium sp. SM-530-WT-3G]|uniref:N-acetylmuramoyl-L-alanine amidase family protein n=1 Tax=Clostridium sp. SM-530-WT-3G TaxID=2725303 RepID=UPI00145DF9BE